ncbi:hypothetical protein SH139x_004807 [Planctomycetaceae bacterium SH139]
MNLKLISALTLVAVVATTGITLAQSPQDRLLDRIKGTKHVGLRADQTLSGYALYLYTSEEHAGNLKKLGQYRKDLNALKARNPSDAEIRRSTQERPPKLDESSAFMLERNRQHPNSKFLRSIQLYDVICVGDDYIELRESEYPSGVSLIPLSRICRVIVYSSSRVKKTGEPGDEPKSR